ncbi:MAG: class I mannose-6-phosphate isomerase [Verrucomicrobiales bacterium]|nr:class I mannose-6-phosphate isomerase [Verrucomicrobiales bacterium]
MNPYPVTFEPQFKERVWGGCRLSELFGKSLPGTNPIGESWEITDRPEGVSVIRNGPWAGRTLRWLLEHHGAAVMGRPLSPGERFPWLIKILDARDDLSLQVHPPAHRAAALCGEPKTEMWYFAAVDPGSRIYVGLKPGVTRGEFEQRVADGSVADCFHVETPSRGDAMFVPSGRVHALGGGSVVFEVQQNSDTTYRVFDWNRKGLDGRPRELHLEPSLASIDFDDVCPGLIRSEWTSEAGALRRPLVRHDLFHIDEWRSETAASIPEGRPPGSLGVLAVIHGGIRLPAADDTLELGAGGFVLIPAAAAPLSLDVLPGTTWLQVTPSSGHRVS